MKRLISLISTHGKPPGQAAQEVWAAFQKYQKAEQQVQSQNLEQPQPVNAPKLSTKKYSNLVDTTNKHLGLVTQITGYPRPPQSQTKQETVVVSETFESLWEYCTSNNRLCLKLEKWNDIYVMLENTKNLSGHGGTREPAHPEIIFHNWDNIMPIEKQFQFERYIEWAYDNNQIEEIGKYLRSLSENDWTHFGEI